MAYGQIFTALTNNIFVQPYMDAYRDAYTPFGEDLINFSHATIYTNVLNTNATDVGGDAGMVIGMDAAGNAVPATNPNTYNPSVLVLGILFMDAAGIPYSNLSNAQVGKGAVLRGLPLLGILRYQLKGDATGNPTLNYAGSLGQKLVAGSTSYLKLYESSVDSAKTVVGYIRAVLTDGTLVVQLAI